MDVEMMCSEHNENITICQCNRICCDKCDIVCSESHIRDTVEEWKKQALLEMDNYKSKLNNRIKELNCITEIINNDSNIEPIIKQIEDIVDTIFVDISHVDNFNQFINTFPISHSIKRKNNITVVSIHTHSEIVDIIIKDGIDKAFQNASENGYLDIVKILIKYGADVQAYNNYAVIWASINYHLDVVEYLIDHGADIHTGNDFLLRNAAFYGHLDVVKYLIAHGADIHAQDDHALRLASQHCHLPVVEYLLSHGANVHGYNDRALSLASENGHLAIVECLIKHGVDIHANNDWALRLSSEKYHLDIIKCLIKNGAAEVLAPSWRCRYSC
jgi:ankyrin repeat protein